MLCRRAFDGEISKIINRIKRRIVVVQNVFEDDVDVDVISHVDARLVKSYKLLQRLLIGQSFGTVFIAKEEQRSRNGTQPDFSLSKEKIYNVVLHGFF